MSDPLPPSRIDARVLGVRADDGHHFELITRVPDGAHARLLWLPALGVAARHYVPFAEALAARGVAVYLHEWRGNGSSSVRPSRHNDWGYRELLQHDIPASEAAIRAATGAGPDTYGGHSLGGQLATCRLALRVQAGEDPATVARALWLVASGAPYWRAFPRPTRYWLPMAYRFLPWLAHRRGALPGRAIGFGGDEARGVITDWARTAITGRYAAPGIDADIEAGMAKLTLPVRAVLPKDDWLAPRSSIGFLLEKLGPGERDLAVLGWEALRASADHFSWMKQPKAVARRLTNLLQHQEPRIVTAAARATTSPE
jgi:predicted alpha/beta hydrolase